MKSIYLDEKKVKYLKLIMSVGYIEICGFIVLSYYNGFSKDYCVALLLIYSMVFLHVRRLRKI